MRFVFIVSMSLLCLAAACQSPPAAAQGVDTAGRADLSAELLAATITALDLEADGYRQKLALARAGTGPAENVDTFKSRVAFCERELERYHEMSPEAYPAPTGTTVPEKFGPVLPAVKREIAVTVRNGYAFGAQLDNDDATRSGPFYRLAGIKGGCPCVLKAGSRYDLTVYLVYRREYFGFIQDCYVYVAEYRLR